MEWVRATKKSCQKFLYKEKAQGQKPRKRFAKKDGKKKRNCEIEIEIVFYFRDMLCLKREVKKQTEEVSFTEELKTK